MTVVLQNYGEFVRGYHRSGSLQLFKRISVGRRSSTWGCEVGDYPVDDNLGCERLAMLRASMNKLTIFSIGKVHELCPVCLQQVHNEEGSGMHTECLSKKMRRKDRRCQSISWSLLVPSAVLFLLDQSLFKRFVS